jgi:hypothetical protein
MGLFINIFTMTKVPLGVSGQPANYNVENIDQTTISNELSLLSLGDFEPLNIKIDTVTLMQELGHFKDDWQDYLPRTDRPNNRKGLTLTTLPGWTHKNAPSLAEASYAAKRRLSELEFNHKTEVYDACRSLEPLFAVFPELGRTFFIKSDIGGYFVPHRDHPAIPRDVFRLVMFANNCGPLDYDWLMNDRKLQIEQGRVYYVNTRKTHRTISWVNDSIHLILNVSMTSENVAKVIANLQHTH